MNPIFRRPYSLKTDFEKTFKGICTEEIINSHCGNGKPPWIWEDYQKYEEATIVD